MIVWALDDVLFISVDPIDLFLFPSSIILSIASKESTGCLDRSYLRLSDVQSSQWPVVRVNQEILDALVVDLKHADADLVPFLRSRCVADSLKDLCRGDWDNSFIGSIANHGVALATASLSVSKQASVVAVPGIVQDFRPEFVVDLPLVCVPIVFWN
eukprot:CAMPEP_0168338168 /NCGR_PEP_ID=MMETSP0213-20121227/12666_1 /TAXON_ID=151035 /ORGANISM="Euplotes harpa, Strain FSP1.4" /LENGTH=156 /DNA_ID=CAMNT_0008343879 /DNA_START=482 /DNA_END=949 /DNA_ORIENTATION=-